MANNIIDLHGVTKIFGNTVALENINLQIENGEFLTLLGPSGCGKTTILRILSGFEKADKGEIFLCGENVGEIPPEHRKVNTVFQSYALFPHMTVMENVEFGLKMSGISNAEAEQRALEALQMVQLDNMGNRKPVQLSGGQQQRVALARAVVNNPKVLLLDEPFSALDYKLRKEMQVEIKRLQRKLGITFIFVTHDQEEAFAMSDRVVVMDHGHIVQIGTPQEVYEEPCNLYVANFVGDSNIFNAEIVSVNEQANSASAIDADGLPRIVYGYHADIGGIKFPVASPRSFSLHDKVHILLRPEDIRVYSPDEIGNSPHLKGKIIDTIYKGATVNIFIEADNGQTIKAAEFFNEDDPTINYNSEERVAITWVEGWEVVLPYENN